MQSMPISQPLNVDAEAGTVIVEGTPGVAISLTPEVALDAADKLMDGAAQAIGQAKMASLANGGRPPFPVGDEVEAHFNAERH